MSWSRKDIIADIEKKQKDWINAGLKPIDITLPYWELKRAYKQRRHLVTGVGTGDWSPGVSPPSNSETEVPNSSQG